MDQVKIGAFIAALRREKGWTQEELGERVGVTNKTVSRWENGNYMPSIEILSLLSGEFGVSLTELVQGQRLEEEDFRAAADQNLASALDRPFDRFRRWLWRNRTAVIIVSLLCVSLATICWELLRYRKAHPADVIMPASFCSNDPGDPIPDSTYLVFDRRGHFFRYRQFVPLEQGTYWQDGEEVTVTVDGISRQFLVKGTRIYEWDETGHFTSYEKFSDIAVFINVHFDSDFDR